MWMITGLATSQKLEKQNPVTDLLGRVGIAYQTFMHLRSLDKKNGY